MKKRVFQRVQFWGRFLDPQTAHRNLSRTVCAKIWWAVLGSGMWTHFRPPELTFFFDLETGTRTPKLHSALALVVAMPGFFVPPVFHSPQTVVHVAELDRWQTLATIVPAPFSPRAALLVGDQPPLTKKVSANKLGLLVRGPRCAHS